MSDRMVKQCTAQRQEQWMTIYSDPLQIGSITLNTSERHTKPVIVNLANPCVHSTSVSITMLGITFQILIWIWATAWFENNAFELMKWKNFFHQTFSTFTILTIMLRYCLIFSLTLVSLSLLTKLLNALTYPFLLLFRWYYTWHTRRNDNP